MAISLPSLFIVCNHIASIRRVAMGFILFVRGVPKTGETKKNVEMYSEGRFLL